MNSGVHYRQYRKRWKLEIILRKQQLTQTFCIWVGMDLNPVPFHIHLGVFAAGTSWIPDVSVVQDVDEELDSSPTTSVRDTDKQLEVPKSSIDCLVDGDATPGELLDITLAQSSIETRDNSGTGPVTSGQENPYDIHGYVNLACKSLLRIGNGFGSEADPKHNV